MTGRPTALTTRLKVAHLEAGRHLYGGALQVEYLLRGLASWPVDNLLICPTGSAIGSLCHPEHRVIEIKMKGDLDLALAPRLVKILRAEGCHLLHVHSRRGADIYGALAARMAGLPALLSRRVDNSEPPWLARLKYQHGYSRVVAISAGIEQVLRAEGVSAARLSVIRDAVDTQQFTPLADKPWFKREFGIGEGDLTVGLVAQLITRKGHSQVLEVLPALCQQFPQLKVLLFGQGPLRRQLVQQVEQLKLAGAVRFCGFRTDLQRVLPCLDVLVHPALQEGLGVALLQASACGVPVLASRAGGIPEAVADGQSGLLYNVGDGAALQVLLSRLLSDAGLRRRLGAQGRLRMEQHFSLKLMARDYFHLYRQLLQAPLSGAD